MDFFYPAEKFAAARHSLMLPHPNGEAASIASAFQECSLGLHGLDKTALGDSESALVRELEDLMDTSGLAGDADEGLYKVKADKLTPDQKFDVSRVVDELASWFRSHITNPGSSE